MMAYFTYEDAKRLNEERVRRSLRRYELAKNETPAEPKPADVIELTFGTHCDHEQSIGA